MMAVVEEKGEEHAVLEGLILPALAVLPESDQIEKLSVCANYFTRERICGYIYVMGS